MISKKAIEAACEAQAIAVAKQDGVVLTTAGFRHGATARPHAHDQMREYVAAGLEAALPFLPIAVEGKVKALEWKPSAFDTPYGLIIRIGKTPFGVYKILKGTQNRYEVYFGDAPYSGSMADEDQAKGWAQSDYETRILSALISSPGKDGGQEVDVRALAVEIVDGLRGYTFEFSGHPTAHAADYDLVEERIRSAIRPHPASTALVEAEQRAVGHGMAIAAAIVMRVWGHSTEATEILNAAGYTSLQKLLDDGVDDYDIDALKPLFEDPFSASQSTSSEGER